MKDLSDSVISFVKTPVVSQPPAISVERVEREYGLDSVIKMCSNENPFGVSPKAKEAMRAEIDKLSLYADPEAEAELRRRVARRIGAEENRIMITAGAAFALNYVGEVFIEQGDEAIVSSPAYPPYFSIIRKSGGTVVDIPQTADMEVDFEAILAGITDKTKVIFVTNPNNPTGRAVNRARIEAFVKRVPGNVLVVVDEAYVQFARDPRTMTCVPLTTVYRNVLVVQTFSKLYGMAAIRVGYAVGSREVIGWLRRVSVSRALNSCGISGAIAALDDDEFARMTLENNAAGRDYLTRELTAMGYKVYPSESNFIYVDCGMDAREVRDKLLPYGIIIRGDFKDLRISIATMEQNRALVEAMKKVMR